jgi:hypothetical protein
VASGAIILFGDGVSRHVVVTMGAQRATSSMTMIDE